MVLVLFLVCAVGALAGGLLFLAGYLLCRRVGAMKLGEDNTWQDHSDWYHRRGKYANRP